MYECQKKRDQQDNSKCFEAHGHANDVSGCGQTFILSRRLIIRERDERAHSFRYVALSNDIGHRCFQVRLADFGECDADGVKQRPEPESGAAIEMTALASPTPAATSVILGDDTCPQCSSASAKTSFMTFDELADVGAINNRAANLPPASSANQSV